MVSRERGANLALQLGIEFMEIKETWNSPIEILFYQIVRAIDNYTHRAKDFDEFRRCPEVRATERRSLGAAFSRWMKSDLDKLKASIQPFRRKTQEADISHLRHAIIHDEQETARCLIQSGLDVNSLDQSGSTLLHIAAALNRVEITKLLLQNGASVDQVLPLNGTALTVAASRGHGEIAQILLAYGARVDIPCDYYENMLQAVARRDNPHILRHLNKRMSWKPYNSKRYSLC
jgi:ankyrin repeat protein